MWHVLVLERIHATGLAILRKQAQVRCAWELTAPEIEHVLSRADALIVRTKPLSRDLISRTDHLKVIGKHGTGVDNIDLAAAREKGIVVVYSPHEHVESVAEHALGLMLAVTKRIAVADRALHRGMACSRDEFTGMELYEKRLGIIGAGRIGACLARKCKQAFSMRVLTYDPGLAGVRRAEVEAAGLEVVAELDVLLSESDVVSLHVPLSEQTRNMIGLEQLRRMRPGAYFINTSRASIVDEQALYQALTEGRLAGAGIDVFGSGSCGETNPLLSLENVCATPHIALATSDALARLSCSVARNVLLALQGSAPATALV